MVKEAKNETKDTSSQDNNSQDGALLGETGGKPFVLDESLLSDDDAD